MRLMATLTTALLTSMLFTTATPAQSQGQAVLPKPFTATYAVTYRGMRAGNLTFKLSRDPATNRYTYETTADPSMLARIMISGSAVERSVMEIGPDGVHPVDWQFDDGKSSTSHDGKLHAHISVHDADGVIGSDSDAIERDVRLLPRS